MEHECMHIKMHTYFPGQSVHDNSLQSKAVWGALQNEPEFYASPVC